MPDLVQVVCDEDNDNNDDYDDGGDDNHDLFVASSYKSET